MVVATSPRDKNTRASLDVATLGREVKEREGRRGQTTLERKRSSV